MNKEINTIIANLEGCIGMFDYLMTPIESNLLVSYIKELQQENKKYKEVIDKAINNSQYWIDYYTRLNSDERIALRLQENIDILKEVKTC